ncbi:DNA-binding transcriptional regulator [Azorhizobium doebereinerae]|uniref:DNA-binding transcriptional regulator n=1 Tax=Azorhizobium doebereinerae TaxID=281091 RepID=UPI00041963BE|nr:DNA-binding transcriptional regulator [Azorhizobium doebereinerae]
MSEPSVESVLRALALLRELNRQRVSSVKHLHAATGLPKATIVRLLKTLCDAQYVTNDRRQGGYQVTSNVKALSCGYHGDPLVVEAARPWAIEFTRQHRWPIAMATFEKDAVFVRLSTIPDSPVSPFHGTINLRLDLLTRALGRAYLAFCPERERALLLDALGVQDEERRTGLAMLARIRNAGFALRDPAVEPRSSNTIAVPVMRGRDVLATIGMTYYNSAYSVPQAVSTFVPLLQALAQRIGESAAALEAQDPAAGAQAHSDPQNAARILP